MTDKKNHHAAEILLQKLQASESDEIIDYLIELGHKNEFIDTMVALMQIVKKRKIHSVVIAISEHINKAYTPGLKSNIIDDFVRQRLAIESEINELKTKHKIYHLEQKLGMYVNAERMLKGPSTALATYLILQIANFRGDL